MLIYLWIMHGMYSMTGLCSDNSETQDAIILGGWFTFSIREKTKWCEPHMRGEKQILKNVNLFLVSVEDSGNSNYILLYRTMNKGLQFVFELYYLWYFNKLRLKYRIPLTTSISFHSFQTLRRIYWIKRLFFADYTKIMTWQHFRYKVTLPDKLNLMLKHRWRKKKKTE